MEYLSVSDITKLIADRIEGDPYLTDVGIVGEVSDVKKRGNHLFFNLTDGLSRLRCVIFGWGRALDLEIGEIVRVIGSVRVYRQGGYYSFNVESFERLGSYGERFESFRKVSEMLHKEGILPRKKMEIDSIPLRIGLITSRDSAAFRDVMNVFESEGVKAKIFLFHTHVQGDEAPLEIVEAVKRAKDFEIDVLMIVRGGGSKDDLWVFNDYEVVKSVATFPRPVVSGIGHSIDSVLLERAVDYNMITPTSAARLVVDVYEKKLKETEELFERMRKSIREKLESIKRETEDLGKRLESVSYSSIMKRGFALVEKGGKRVRGISEVKQGDELVLRFLDGKVKVLVIERDGGEAEGDRHETRG